ncbi:2Fe-2S ferredoxin [Streptosporangium becharense]|uniref:2Fe-2S ferredoxin n=1 Tax=Streptosporangium becharense TaxID=1816182 RepID=A0A7W9MJS8_9ACTN|nr:2Fe-2S iron-sulfur cluster-binding protein [Streptosporangium becharense]MBB2914381.1 2Fe-2S ferredoxin [Streptosporangium becharense]MBB5823587.1 2Fe-2S ferredoxin [Streptosporangium becharense]
MPKIFYTQPDGRQTALEATAGDSVMQTAVRNGVSGIVGQCGGSLSCATCHVFLAEENTDDFPPVGDDEDEMLDCAATERQDNSRLSCQLILREGQEVHVTIPEAQL